MLFHHVFMFIMSVIMSSIDDYYDYYDYYEYYMFIPSLIVADK